MTLLLCIHSMIVTVVAPIVGWVIVHVQPLQITCADPEFLSEGVQLWQCFSFFLLKGGRIQTNTTINGQSSNAIYMAFRWRADDGWLCSVVIFQGSGLVLLRNPIFLRLFRRGGSGPPVTPSGSAHESAGR